MMPPQLTWALQDDSLITWAMSITGSMILSTPYLPMYSRKRSLYGAHARKLLEPSRERSAPSQAAIPAAVTSRSGRSRSTKRRTATTVIPSHAVHK